MMKLTLWMCLSALSAAACSNQVVTPSDADAPRILVTSDRAEEFQTELSVVGSGSVTANSVAVAGELESALLLVDSATLLMGVVHADSRRDLVAVDTRTLLERWRRSVSNRLVPIEQAEIGIRAVTGLTASLDGKWVYVSQAIRQGVVGIARVNAQTNVAEAFSGPWLLGGTMSVLPSGVGHPDGALAMVASRENSSGGVLRSPSVFLLHPLSLVPFDSLSATDLENPDAIINLIVLDGGGSLLIGTSSRLLRFDLALRRITASAPRPGLGAIVASVDERTFAVLDQGRFPELAGSGRIYLFGPQLAMLDSIDVSTPLGGAPQSPLATVMGGAVFDDATGDLYVRTGSAPFGSLYPTQPARVVVVNVRERRVTRVVPLLGDNFGFAFRLPPIR